MVSLVFGIISDLGNLNEYLTARKVDICQMHNRSKGNILQDYHIVKTFFEPGCAI